MRLSECFPKERVLKDTSFDALGLSNSEVKADLLSFLEDARFMNELIVNQHICAVICKKEDAEMLAEHICGVVVSDNPRKDYFELHNRLAQKEEYFPALQPTVIGQNCSISPHAVIAPFGVKIGNGVTVEEFAVVRGPCEIGDGCVLHAGVKIGGAGYEFKFFGDDVLDVVHCGGVKIGRNVIFWENATVHRAVYPWDLTEIGDNCRISAQAHIDHGAKLACCVKVCAGAVVSGRTAIGSHTNIGPGSVLSNRICVGENAHVVLGSVVTKNVPDGGQVSGNFAIDHKKHIELVKKQVL